MSTTNMYQVVDSTTKAVMATGFAKRKDAKPTRNKMNEEAKTTKFIVSRGDDHPHGPSFGPVANQSRYWL